MGIGVLSNNNDDVAMQRSFQELFCRNKYRPVRKHLLAEADRRFICLRMKKVGVWNWKPTTRWNMKQIRKWLEQNPLKDPDEVEFLHTEFANLQERVAKEAANEELQQQQQAAAAAASGSSSETESQGDSSSTASSAVAVAVALQQQQDQQERLLGRSLLLSSSQRNGETSLSAKTTNDDTGGVVAMEATILTDSDRTTVSA